MSPPRTSRLYVSLVLLAVLLLAIAAASRVSEPRVFKYVAVVGVGKEPADDPWTDRAHRMIPTGWHWYTKIHGFWMNTDIYSVSVHAHFSESLKMFTQVRIKAEFSFHSDVTKAVHLASCVNLGVGSYDCVAVMYVPERSWSRTLTYEWTITMSAYVSHSLGAMPFLPAPPDGYFVSISSPSGSAYAAACTSGNFISGDDITNSVSTRHVDDSKFIVTYVIRFGSSWAGKRIDYCEVFVNNQDVLNELKNRGINTDKVVVAYVRPDFVASSGDTIIIEVWMVAQGA